MLVSNKLRSREIKERRFSLNLSNVQKQSGGYEDYKSSYRELYGKKSNDFGDKESILLKSKQKRHEKQDTPKSTG